ncbi:endonuclease/exonuclease/phosphatase family protein [Tenacibaculum jejuense]|uniref:Endonuclease/exonuclease/phosphatase domain-containing protein n=1 Tax=Tenacibaculum jejuense TaxID=584609 RepID=A0A238UC56_9FLAO|nr:endonuclease/exonuclease/phosphatase family protein [Tenacibaculum jejuense]SNR16793.1 protein of unknown function [Tenacibaculum jejuense]
MKKYFNKFLPLVFLIFFSCTDNMTLIEENELERKAISKSKEKELQFVTYNIHGGKGPNDEGNLKDNLKAFKKLLKEEKILFFQEVKPEMLKTIKEIFNEFKYVFFTEIQAEKKFWNWSSFSWRTKKGGILTLSKIPFYQSHSKEIQKDPGGDRWKRKAQHVSFTFKNQNIDFFHYHNTYNWNINNFESEKEGMNKFKDYINSRLGSNIEFYNNIVVLGDYNLFVEDVKDIIKTKSHYYDGRDHINSNRKFIKKGKYNTIEMKLSDHRAIWGRIE